MRTTPMGRDMRLDFFRGLAMFVIFISHLPGNSWFALIPARFGFSSAGELFVFCSGVASGYAFGWYFLRDGWLAGTKRILFRVWQVYWAHIGVTLAMIALSVIGLSITGTDYPSRLGLDWLFAHPGDGLLRLMSLQLMPNYLDILPMYLVLLAMIPLVMGLARISAKAMMALLLALWLGVQLTGVNLPGGTAPGMEAYFNALAWQLIFFTGFAFALGWLRVPALVKGRLFWLCVGVLVVSVPLNFWGVLENVPVLEVLRGMILPEASKTNLHALLYLHFLASAYVALVLVEPYRTGLAQFRLIVLVGQHALATFMAGLLFAWGGGMVLDVLGRDQATIALVNIAGCAGLIGVAAMARAYRGKGGESAKPARAEESGKPLPRAGYASPAE